MMFEDWLLAIGFPTGDEYGARKRRFFERVLVPKVTEFMRRWPQIYVKITPQQRSESKTILFRKAAPYFSVRSLREGNTGETILQYVTAFREMAVKCEFLPVS